MSNDDDDKYRRYMSRKMAELIVQRLPGLTISVDLVEQQVYTNLLDELFDYDMTQRSPKKELDEIRDSIVKSLLGVLPTFGESIDELTEEGRKRRRIVNAAIRAAADAEYDFAEMIRVGVHNWDVTGPIERRTTHIVRMNRLRLRIFMLLSITGVGLLGAAVWLSWLSWITGIVTAVCWIIGVRSGTRLIDVHDHA